jgi:hypothetical protein
MATVTEHISHHHPVWKNFFQEIGSDLGVFCLSEEPSFIATIRVCDVLESHGKRGDKGERCGEERREEGRLRRGTGSFSEGDALGAK